MFLRIQNLAPKRLVGFSARMSLSHNGTRELWQRFRVRQKEILGVLAPELYSLQIYPPNWSPASFSPLTEFTKWAAIEVADDAALPPGMGELDLPGGNYAVFLHKGPPSTFPRTAQYIYGMWLPHSAYELDDRPHFELLGEKYKGPFAEDSEEEVWIPLKNKKAGS